MKKQFILALILSIITNLANAQVQKVTGVVISEEDGQPVIGATILLEGTQKGTVTDINGQFTLTDIPENANMLQISFVGMQTKEVPVKPIVKVILKPASEELEEIVVTGYGVTRKAAFTGAATTVDGSKITNRNDANPIKALEGTVPGLQMFTGSGQPGAPATIYVRGRNSLNSGTQPLYVVDGVPFFANEVGIYSSEGQATSPLASLNPNDIESMTVLKDATATSIYGARAANGVIVITTKKGKAGKPQVNLTAKIGIQTMPATPRGYKRVNSAEFLELTQEALLNGYKDAKEHSLFGYYNQTYGLGLNPDKEGALSFFDWYSNGWYSQYLEHGYNTDWMDEVTRTGLTQEYSFDINGGGNTPNAVKYYLSMAYTDEKAIVISKDFTRYSFRFNMEHQPISKIQYGFNTSFSYTDVNLGIGGGYFSDPISMGRMMNPLTPVRTPDGEWNVDTSYAGYNPVAMRSENGDKDNMKTYRLILSPFIQLNLSKQLFWQTRASIDFMLTDEFNFSSPLYPSGEVYNGRGENCYHTNIQMSITNTLNYIHTLGEHHHVNFLLGQEGQQSKTKEAYLAGANYPKGDLLEIGNASIPLNVNTYKNELVLASFFTNAQYDYADKYYASASLRYDASSRFGSNNRWAPFWSVGFKYRITNEPFMENTRNWLTNLTLRSSYGTSGNQEVGNSWYASQDLFGFGENYNNLPGMSHDRFGNKDLKWEQTRKFNVGMDITLFNRINIELDYYNHLTKDMVFAVPVSMTTGLNSYYKNIGKLSNEGLEASIHAQLIQAQDWTWNASITGSFNKNRIKQLNTDTPIEGSLTITETGRPIRQFKMRQYAGVNPETGEAMWYKGETGTETTTNYNEAGKRYVGSPNPDFSGTFSTSLHWKNLDFSVQLNYSVGAKIYGSNLHYDEQLGTSMLESYTYYVYENRWQNPGDITDVPRLTTEGTYENNISTRFLMDGDYLKIRSVALGYALPKTWLSRTGIKHCRFFVNAENIYTFCAKNFRGFDPAGIESNGMQWWNYPLPMSIAMGVTLGF